MTRMIDRTLVGVTISRFQALIQDCSGGTLIWFALTLPVMLGMTGVGVDAALWYMDRRILQTASDSSAVAGAHVLAQGGTNVEAKMVVETEIARNDFAKTTNDVITVNMPPKSGPNTGVVGFVEVLIDKQRPLYFARFFRNEPTVIQARAVSGQRPVASEHCVLALDKNIDASLSFTGTADANINCGVGTNSRSDTAVDLNGGAMVDVDYMEAYGDIAISGSSILITDTPPQPYSNYVSDPYADLEVPADSPCDHEPLTTVGVSQTLEPGRYCGGLSITSPDFSNPLMHRGGESRKMAIRQSLTAIPERPRCKQSVAQHCSNLNRLNGTRLWPGSMAESSHRMPEGCCWGGWIAASG